MLILKVRGHLLIIYVFYLKHISINAHEELLITICVQIVEQALY